MARASVDIEDKLVDVRDFKRDFVGTDFVTMRGLYEGLKHDCWHADRIPRDVLDVMEKMRPGERRRNCLRQEILDGRKMFLDSRYEEAIACYDRAMSDDPGYSVAYFYKGDALLRMGKHEKAVECYVGALDADPDEHGAMYSRCDMLAGRGLYEEALACYDSIIKHAPYLYVTYCLKGAVLDLLGRYGEALECYGEAAGLEPGSAVPLYGRSRALAGLGRDAEATKYLEDASRIDSRRPDSFHAAVSALARLERCEGLLAGYQRAIHDMVYGSRTPPGGSEILRECHDDADSMALYMRGTSGPYVPGAWARPARR